MYVYAENGGQTVPELAPSDEDIRMGKVLKSSHLNKFADVDEHGKSIFATKLQALGVDTLVIIGAWTEDCVVGTVAEGVDMLNLDVVLVKEAVGTATPDHFPGMELMKSGWTKVVTTEEMTSYLKSENSEKLWESGRTVLAVEPPLGHASPIVLSMPGLLAALASTCLLGALCGAGFMMRMMRLQKVTQKLVDPLLSQP